MGKLEAVRATEGLIELLEKSGILADKQLEQAKLACPPGGDLKTAARRLLSEKLVTLWQAKQLLSGSAALRFGKFKLLDEIGGGPFGRVYLAEHGQLGRRVALKVLSRRHTNDQQGINDFLAQSSEVASLDHRNLIHVYDVGSEGDRYFVVMEYAEGKDLSKVLGEAGPLAVDRAAEYVRQAAEGLAHAHEHHVWHCDLKPGNVLIDAQNSVKILDIGVAKLSAVVQVPTGDSAEGPEGDTLGAFFQAPELKGAQADSETAGALADVFSLGAILQFLLTGLPPSAQLVDGKIVRTEQPASLTDLRRDLPQELVELCAKMTSKESSRRPQTMVEVAKSLESWLAENVARVAEEKAKADSVPNVSIRTSAQKLGAQKIGAPKNGAAKPSANRLSAASLSANAGVAHAETAATGTSVAKASAAPAINRPDSNAKKPGTAPPIRSTLAVAGANSNSKTPVLEDSSAFATNVLSPKTGAPPIRKSLPKAKSLSSISEAKAATRDSSVMASDSTVSDASPALETDSSFGFSIDTKPTSGKKKKKSDSNLDVASTNDSSEFAVPASKAKSTGEKAGGKSAPPKKGSKKKGAKESPAFKLPPTKILILIGSVAGVLLLTVVGLAAYAFTSGGGKQKTIAKAAAVQPEEADATANDPSATDKKSDATETKPAEPPAAAAALEAGKLQADAKPADPVKAAEPVSPSDTAIAATPEPAPPEVKPSPPAKPVEVAKVEPKPEPKVEPKPKPVADPFVGFPKQIELPAISVDGSAAAPVELGPIRIDARALCIMHLVGNDNAIKGGKQKFAIEAGDNGTSTRDWDIFFRDANSESGGTKIANLSIQDQKLMFGWAPEANSQKLSGQFRNCILSMASGPKSHAVALRKPTEEQPLSFDVKKPTMKETYKITSPPDPSKVKVRISVVGATVKHRFEAKSVVDADQDSTYLCFGENDIDMIFKLKIDTSMKQNMEFMLTPMHQLTGRPKPEKLIMKSLKQMEQQAQNDVTQINNALTQLKSIKPPPGAKLPPEPVQIQIGKGEEELKYAQQRSIQAAQLKNIVDSVGASAKIHFEVFLVSEGKELMLATTNPPKKGP